MKANDAGGEGASGGGFPGVKSLFGKKGFPGTLKLSRHVRNESDGGRQTPSGKDGVPSSPSNAIEDRIGDISLGAPSPQQGGATPSNGHENNRSGTPGASPSAPPVGTGSSTSSPAPPTPSGGNDQDAEAGPPPVPVSALRSMSEPRLAKFARILDEQVVDLDALRELAWSGIPPNLRPLCWRLLLGYLPPNRDRRDQVLARKRREYRDLLPEYYDSAALAAGMSSSTLSTLRATDEESALRQVAVDVPRTAPGVLFFHQPRMHKSLERILYIWGVRHPASGYVQGINDLVTPFLAVFMSEHFLGEMEGWMLDELPDEQLLEVEADCYWCLCKLLDGIQDHYTYAQPGIQKTLFHVQELVSRVENSTAEHFNKEGVEFMQFAFRWVNCLLVRELPFQLGIRLWDTYLAEGAALKEFLVYVVSSFLLSWAPLLRGMEFQDLIMFLQRVPTQDWTESDVELVLSRAYMWRASFKDASSHFA